MNSKRILLIAFNAFVLGTVISMITSGNNWDSTAVHVSSAFSLGLNILFLEYIGLKGDKSVKQKSIKTYKKRQT